MRVTDLELLERDDRMRASASVLWEDCDRPARSIYFETEQPFGADLSANPNAFLLATCIPAALHGERRVRVEGPLCPRLREGAMTSLRLLSHWYQTEIADSFVIESDAGFEATPPAEARQAACTMSGGVDSLATLRRNREQLPLDHPLSIRTCFLAYGIDIGGYESLPGNQDHFDHVKQLLQPLARQTDVALVPVHTNMRHLDDSDALFSTAWFGAALAALGHAFGKRIATMYIPSGNSFYDLFPSGSHPLLDPGYGSADLRIIYDGFGLLRLEKVGVVAAWPEALARLRSCYAPFRDAEAVNCGRCEKCLRTMTELLVHGKLPDAETFPLDDVSSEHLEVLLPRIPLSERTTREAYLRDPWPILTEHSVDMWNEMRGPLESMGRGDLAGVIAEKVRLFHHYRALQNAEISFRQAPLRATAQGLKSVVARFDQRFLGGNLRLAYRRMQGTA